MAREARACGSFFIGRRSRSAVEAGSSRSPAVSSTSGPQVLPHYRCPGSSHDARGRFVRVLDAGCWKAEALGRANASCRRPWTTLGGWIAMPWRTARPEGHHAAAHTVGLGQGSELRSSGTLGSITRLDKRARPALISTRPESKGLPRFPARALRSRASHGNRCRRKTAHQPHESRQLPSFDASKPWATKQQKHDESLDKGRSLDLGYRAGGVDRQPAQGRGSARRGERGTHANTSGSAWDPSERRFRGAKARERRRHGRGLSGRDVAG